MGTRRAAFLLISAKVRNVIQVWSLVLLSRTAKRIPNFALVHRCCAALFTSLRALFAFVIYPIENVSNTDNPEQV